MASCSNKRRRFSEKEQHDMVTDFIDNIGEADEYESIETEVTR